MKIHMFSYHQVKDLKSVKKTCVKSLPNVLVKTEHAAKRVRISNQVKPSEEKEEYIQHFQTPKATPEPSPIKKKVKENPKTEDVSSKVFLQEANKNIGIGSESNKKEVEYDKKENSLENKQNEPIRKRESGTIVKDDKTDEVALEVALLIENLQKEVKAKDEKVKFLESEKKGLESKVLNMRTCLEVSEETVKKVERDKELLHMEYMKCIAANKEAMKETEKLKHDYKECSQKLNFTQRRSDELAESLRVTEAVLQAQEEEEDEDEAEDEIVISEDQDDEDFLEDEDQPGVLWQVVPTEINCKKCDEKVQGNKSLREHMKKHVKEQNEVLPCYYCEFKTSKENEFLNHISRVHGAGNNCLTCNSSFKTHEDMIKHVVDVHQCDKKLVKEKCVSCGQEFAKVEYLTEHILRHHTMLTATGQAHMAGQQLVKIWPLQESLKNLVKCFDCQNMFESKGQLINHKKERHYKQKMCNFYHKHGNCRFGDQCINVHEDNNHMYSNHGQEQHPQQSNIKCMNGPTCQFRKENRCNFSHASESVIHVRNVSNAEHTTRNTSVFNMEKLIESLGARIEKIEHSVPNMNSMQDFPSVEESRAKQKVA